MNLIYMILKMVNDISGKAKESIMKAVKAIVLKMPEIKITVSKIWEAAYSPVKSVPHNVKTVMEKTFMTLDGSYGSMKRCV